jgi:hypothetical protein
MPRSRKLIWFYARPTLHSALSERAERRGHAIAAEVLAILESALLPRQPQPLHRREHLRVLPSDGDSDFETAPSV